MINSDIYQLMVGIFESIYAALAVDAEGKIAYINKKYAEILEVDPTEAIGQPVEKIVPRTRMPLVIQTGQEEIGSVYKMKNGVPIVCNRIPIKNNDKIVGAVAFTTFTKMDELSTFIKQIQRLSLELDLYKDELGKLRGAKYSLNQIIGNTVQMKKLKELTQKVAQTKSTVLIVGETGTGKELFAHALHQLSPRNFNPFIRLNCAAIPKDLLESELFGYEEGAFTGAKKGGKLGKFELAHGGTLLLDEINQLPFDLQSKLLRVIQEKEIERVGGLKTVDIDVRLICITNQNLLGLVKKGEFREDLFYRINVVELNIPPLRERLADIPELANYCLAKINKELGLNIKGIDNKVLDIFGHYHWPGNVRELEHVLERAANMALSGCLKREHFDFFMLRIGNKYAPRTPGPDSSLEDIRISAEKEAIIQAIDRAGGNKTAAAEILKIDRSVLYDKIRKYGIS